MVGVLGLVATGKGKSGIDPTEERSEVLEDEVPIVSDAESSDTREFGAA